MPAAPPRTSALGAALAHARAHRPRFVEELKTFVRFPTVGTQPKHAADMARCARWLAEHLRGLGLRAALVPGPGHPVVRAEWRKAPGRPTVLLYGHYDVQPAEPLDLWHSPPFEPVVREGVLYGRGACDDKGQMWAHVKALESWMRTAGRLPVNVVCLFEGEEESGSAGLTAFLERHGRELGADVAVVSDMAMRGPGVPAITYAMRGALGVELEVRRAGGELHSGVFGGAVANPLEALCAIVAGLHDARGRVAIPGFYDAVRAPEPGERAYLRRTGPTDAELLRDAGVERGDGERGYGAYERTALRPSLSVNGVTGGYSGDGVKAVIPARAVAKLSFRLVADQDPHEVDRLFRAHVARVAPPSVDAEVRTSFGARPVLLSPRDPALRSAAAAVREAFGRAPVFLRSGGTIPVVGVMAERLGIPVVLVGFGLPDDGMHAPNEKFRLANLYRGIEASIRLLARAASATS